MEGEREYSPPFWPQPQRRPSPSSSSGLRPWVLVLLASIFIILFLPSFLSSSFRGLRPGGLIRNGWDTLNLCLVLFAILCGLLGRNNGDEAEKSPRSGEWPVVGYSAPPLVTNRYGEPAVNPTAGIRRMRSSSSYPDLRQEAVAAWGGIADGWRFSDDIQLYHRGRRSEVEIKTIPLGSGEGWRFSDDVQMYHRGWRSENSHRALESTPEAESKTIPVDTFVLRKSPPRSRSPPPTPPPPPPLPPPHGHSRKRSVRNKLPEKEVEQETKMEEEKPQQPPLPPPPPPPPPATRAEKRSSKKKNGGGAKDMATAIALFYHKKRKKGSKTNKFHDDTSPLANAPQAAVLPPPPPPPPPSSLFHQLFSHKKVGSKSRRIHSTPAPPPPPPPPPPPAPPKRRSKKHVSPPPPPPPPPRTQKTRDQVSFSPPPPPPPAPPQVNLYNKREKSNLSRFSLPPSSSLPPPPPPPPSPPPTDQQLRFSKEEIVVNGILGGGEGIEGEKTEGNEQVPLVFCPSPDVNNKADLFIARFRAGLKLEKLNSLREKQRRKQEQQHQDEEFMMVGGIFDDDIIPTGASPSTAIAGGGAGAAAAASTRCSKIDFFSAKKSL